MIGMAERAIGSEALDLAWTGVLDRGGGFFFKAGRRRALSAAVAARRKPHRRRDGLMEIGRVLAKSDEALMANLGVGFSSALERQRAPTASNGGGGVGSSW